LGCDCRGNGIAGAGKGGEEGIPLGIDLVAIEREERRAQQGLACFQYASIALTELLKQARGALDIREEQSDRSAWEFTHAAPPVARAQPIPDAHRWLGSRLAVCLFALLYLIY